MNTATPAHSKNPGSMVTRSFSAVAFSQSSSRPTMIVQTGPIEVTSRFSASRRRSPRSIASPTTTACDTVNETVALTLIPR